MPTTPTTAIIFDAIRTPIGRYGGVLAGVRGDDLAALPVAELMRRNPAVAWRAVDDVVLGCANQAGEDNRNVARMAALLAGLPPGVPGVTVNRLCGSGLDAVSIAARAIACGEAEMVIAGGVESMSRAPFVMPKAGVAFTRAAEIYDTTLGWRFVNPRLQWQYGSESMARTAENVAVEFGVSRRDQDAFALRSQQRAAAAREWLGGEIMPVSPPLVAKRTAAVAPTPVTADQHPRADTTLDALSRLPALFPSGEGDTSSSKGGTPSGEGNPPPTNGGNITAGNAAGISDGACALLLGSAAAGARYGLTAAARVVATTRVGVEPRVMGFAPAPAVEKLLARTGIALREVAVIEINEAFAAQVLATTRHLGLADAAAHVNPNGGAIALGHPLGMSGARLVTTAVRQLHRYGGRYAICAMCIGVGQGIAMLIENLRHAD